MYAFAYVDELTMLSAIAPDGSVDGTGVGVAPACDAGVGVGVGLLAGVVVGLLAEAGVALGFAVAAGAEVTVGAEDGATFVPEDAGGLPPPPLQAPSVSAVNSSTRFIVAHFAVARRGYLRSDVSTCESVIAATF